MWRRGRWPGADGGAAVPEGDGGALAELWSDEKYSQTYDLVSTEAQATVKKQDFVDRYKAITDEARIDSIEYTIAEPAAGVTDVPFEVVFHTSFFGNIPQDNVMPMVREEVVAPATEEGGDPVRKDEWRVQWAPSLFFKELDDRSLVHFFTRVPRRGTIYDRNQTALAIDADLPVIGIVPDLVVDKEAVIAALTPALGMTDAEVRAIVESDVPSYYFVPVKTLPYGTTPDQIQVFRDMVDLGVVVRDQTLRVYPYGDAAAHVLGVHDGGVGGAAGTLGPQGLRQAICSSGRLRQSTTCWREAGALLATVNRKGRRGDDCGRRRSRAGSSGAGHQHPEAGRGGGGQGGRAGGDGPARQRGATLASFPRFDERVHPRLTNDRSKRLLQRRAAAFLNRALLAGTRRRSR
jgi:hypothetical protein